MATRRFAAIDFETADFGRDSACSVGIARVQDGRLIERREHLIRPATRRFVFTRIHGIGAADVRDAPTFAELWPEVLARLEGAAFLVAHNAPFDRSVLRACCRAAELADPDYQARAAELLARRGRSRRVDALQGGSISEPGLARSATGDGASAAGRRPRRQRGEAT